jgi:hypothetical protein
VNSFGSGWLQMAQTKKAHRAVSLSRYCVWCGTKSRTNFYVYDSYAFSMIFLTDLSLKVSLLPPLVD